MTIRKIQLDEYQAVDKLMQQLHKVHVHGRPDLYTDLEHPYSEEKFRELVESEEVISLAAQEAGRVVGICFATMRKKSGMVAMRTVYVDDLVVEESFQGQGIAKALFEEMERQAKILGARRIDLMVWAFNEKAIMLYEELGMKPQRYFFEKDLEN